MLQTAATKALSAGITDAKSVVQASRDGGRLRIDPNIRRWFLLCRQLRLQLDTRRLHCLKLVEYILRLHAVLAASGVHAVIEPLPEEIAGYVGVEGVQARQEPVAPQG